jgi:hypothetical protein
LGRRGPGSGLRQARSALEAVQWRRLFDALASPQAQLVLPHLGLRSGDALALRDTAGRVRDSLDAILAETRRAGLLARANDALAAAYADLEHQHCARLARGVFALSSDGFPGPDAAGLMVAWEHSLRAMAEGHEQHTGIPAAKRDIVVALIGHHLAAIEPLDTVAAEHAAADLDWLVALARWRRYASVSRALAKMLTPSERLRLVGFAAPPDPCEADGRRDVMREAG